MINCKYNYFLGEMIVKILRSVVPVFASFLSIGIFLSNQLMYIKKKDDKFILNREKEAGRFDPIQFEQLPKREILISSPFGYPIKMIVIEPFQTNKYMIFCHGVTENKTNSVKYMNIFLQRGFNAIIYDHRRHGESGGKTTSYGYYEKFDLKTIVDWLKREKGEDLLLGIHGESMGAATVLLYAGMVEDGADFYIADCPYSDFKQLLDHRLKKGVKFAPKFIINIADLFINIRQKYSLNDVSPIHVVNRIEHPILFIHSKQDDYILPSMTEKLYEQKRGPKKLFLADNGAHAQSYNENKEEYEKAIDEFLQDFVYQANI